MNASIIFSASLVRQLALGFVFSLGVGHRAAAVPLPSSSPLLLFQDFVPLGSTLIAGQSVNGTFNILNAGAGATAIMEGYANAGQTFSDIGGYVPPNPLTLTKAYFYIRDGNQGNDAVGLNLGGSQFFNSATGSGSTYAILEGLADLSLLQTNGMLGYSISNLSESRGSSFTVDYVQLQVVSPVDSSPVPDGGASIALLIAGLAALVFIKLRSKI